MSKVWIAGIQPVIIFFTDEYAVRSHGNNNCTVSDGLGIVNNCQDKSCSTIRLPPYRAALGNVPGSNNIPNTYYKNRNKSNYRKRLLLTGNCWYELTGLWYLLSDENHDIYRAPAGYFCSSTAFELTVVALSAEPIITWSRHISWIKELRRKMTGNMILLVPERFKSLVSLHDICEVYSGHSTPEQLRSLIYGILGK